uniref:Uncharacterized protein n=1 Tax=Aegilops tauschii subsp. strangulata TaxID=200361 RepID=A0A453K5Q4_AEGTS
MVCKTLYYHPRYKKIHPTPDPDPLHPRPPFHLLSSPNPLAVGPAEEQRRGHGDEQETRRVRCPRRRARLLARPARSRGPSPPSASPKPVPHSSLLIRAGLLRLRREVRADLGSTERLCRLISSRSRRLRAPCRDVVLYALSVGACGADAVDEKELDLVHHRDGQRHIKDIDSVTL